MELVVLTIFQFLASFVIVATVGLVVWLISKFIQKPQPISGEVYLYIVPSDNDFFNMITEFRNDFSGK